LQIECASSDLSEQLAEKLAANLKGGEVIELVSDLGGGKTTFTRGLVRGLGISAHVTSPTFKISNVYTAMEAEKNAGKPERVYHYDFYRLQDAGLMGHELQDSLEDDRGVIIIEWGTVADDALPAERLKITITKTAEDSRLFEISASESHKYLTKGLK
jgi:tRNA threonylcarbamoyladenosine biosynthesis protein TsaE